MAVQELKYDVRRGADTYSAVYHPRLKGWIIKGIINRDEALVWRSGLSGWRRPEELEELKPYFEEREKNLLNRARARRGPCAFHRKAIKRILIVDDEEDLCWLLSSALEAEGYDVGTAGNIARGIAMLEDKPDLVLVDLRLPDGDGMELLPMIQEKCREALIIIISAYGSNDRMADATEKGVFDFIDKPFTVEKIMHLLKRLQKGEAGNIG